MMSILGCSLSDVGEILQKLGFRMERVPQAPREEKKPEEKRPEPVTDQPAAGQADGLPPAAAEPAQPSFYQRALSFVPLLGGSSSSASGEQAPIASTVPETPQTVTAPLPPRRSSALRTSQLQQPAAAYASQSAAR